MHGIWENNSKYAKVDGVKLCWRKENIIPLAWNSDINNYVGSDYFPNKDKVISAKECNEIFSMMKKTHVRISIYASKWPSVISTASALDASFIMEHDAMNLQDNEWTKMVNS